METKERSSLSLVASEILRYRQADMAYVDVRLVGAPSECMGYILERSERALLGILADHGWTKDDYNEALEERVSGRAYFEYSIA